MYVTVSHVSIGVGESLRIVLVIRAGRKVAGRVRR
jgi:hypothetical protein